MSAGRQRNGQFGPGNRANPGGRPRKSSSVNATILKELNAPVQVTENQKRRRITKLAANAKQVANKGASGDMRAAKMAIELAIRAERDRDGAPTTATLTMSDREIVERFFTRRMLAQGTEISDAAAGD